MKRLDAVTTISYAMCQIGWGISIIIFALDKNPDLHDSVIVASMSFMCAAVEVATAIKSAKAATMIVNLVRGDAQ